MRHLHLDPLGGLAGDMFLAALLDAFPEHADGVVAAMRAAGLPAEWRAALIGHGDGTLTGRRFAIRAPSAGPVHPSGHWHEIRARLTAADLAPRVRARAIAIFSLLAEAEAAVHGIAVDEVHFHELADWDSIADVVGAAWLIEAVQPATWSTAPLPVGGGRVGTQHGTLPVPAPATARLLEGLAMLDDGIAGERVTPTGAAILRQLAPAPHLPGGAWRIAGSGLGFGTRRLDGIANVLRVLAYEPAEGARAVERVAVLAFEVDDQSAEDLAIGLDELRATEGVLDVAQLPFAGKKGRLGTQVQVLARPERLDTVLDRCFLETTTLGIRFRLEARAVLARGSVGATDVEDEVPVKVVRRPGGQRTAKAEIEAVRGTPGGHAGRAARRHAAEARALGEGFEVTDAPRGGQTR
jgi:uncharacterized protein (TIGR00299 family) protein